MSSEHDTSADPRAEDDHVDARSVILVGVGALLLFAVAGASAIAYLHHRAGQKPGPPLPEEIGSTKIALVEQQLFESGPLRGDRARAAQRARLEGIGWVDRAAGVVHIPIDRAMALVVAGQRAPRGAAPSPPPLGAEHGGVDAPSVPIGPPTPAPAAAPAPGKGGKK
jgi:hypothetical protein